MTWSPWTLASRALTTALVCLLPVVAHAQPPAPTAPVQVTPSPAPAATTSAATPPPSAPPGAQGHWVYVQETPPPATTPAAPVAPEPVIKRGPVYTKANTWDVNVDGAFGRYFGDEADKWTGFVRARAGILFVREPLYNAIGFTYEYSSLANATFGIQAEVLHLDSGFWGQLGGLLDTHGNPGVMAAFGFSVLGVEAQYRSYPGLGDGVAVYVKVRAPVGVLAYLLGQRDAKMAPATAQPSPASSK